MIEAHDSPIVRSASRLLIPLMQLFGLYILFFGQYGPGGGFAGGVILGTSLLLAILVLAPQTPPCRLAHKLEHGDGLGLVIFVGVGGLCLIGGGEFLNYSNLQLPGLDNAARRSLGIVLTQIGVAADIAVTALSIVFSLGQQSSQEASHE
ncbi:MAG: MnhB domain-containing protein [Planctomycetota bacterium]|nr:MnhB domain-containing protein [Planctomycetota bacterium]